MGFLTICSGVVLLQLAKSSKDVPDSKVFSGDLDQIRTVAEVEEPEYEPRADAVRGGAGILRAFSGARHKREAEEAHRIHDEAHMETIGENDQFEWDGVRRRRTVSTVGGGGSIIRRKTVHPPLGMSQFPSDDDDVSEPDSEVHPGFFGRIGRGITQRRNRGHSPVAMETVTTDKHDDDDDAVRQGAHVYGLAPGLQKGHLDEVYEDTAYRSPLKDGSHIQWAAGEERPSSATSSLAPPRPPPHTTGGAPSTARRQFSFQNVFSRNRSASGNEEAAYRPTSRGALSFVSRGGSSRGGGNYPGAMGNATTEEERLGLVHGDSNNAMTSPSQGAGIEEEEEEEERSSDEWARVEQRGGLSDGSSPEIITASSGDLGRRTRKRDPYADDGDDDDDLYDAPPPPRLRSPSPENEEENSRKGGGGGGGGSGAFV